MKRLTRPNVLLSDKLIGHQAKRLLTPSFDVAQVCFTLALAWTCPACGFKNHLDQVGIHFNTETKEIRAVEVENAMCSCSRCTIRFDFDGMTEDGKGQ